jgi:signal transduction histidine kinase
MSNEKPEPSEVRKSGEILAATLDALQIQQIEQMRATIAELMIVTEKNGQIKQRHDAFAKLVPQLRAANEHLILAAFEAQDGRAAAEALNRRQTEFLSMLAHELRNPLHPIVMANHMIAQLHSEVTGLPPLQAIIERQIGHLVRLIDDLMDASRASSGKLQVRSDRLNLMEAIEHAVETSQFIIEDRQQRLQLEAPDQALYIDGDLLRLAQMFSNLLLNASKYTPSHGAISVGVRVEEQQVAVRISDNGAGIPLQVQPYVFDLFTQGPAPPNSAPGGLGIGLSLVRQIAQLHNGSVSVYSPGSGLGSVFTVTLPLAEQPAPTAQPTPRRDRPAPVPRRILYIEDNVVANELLRRVLELDHHTVTCRYDGASGLEAAQQGGYDAIIMDIGLPGLTGDLIARTLRRQEGGTTSCLIALSGFAAPEHGGSFDHYLNKPVSMAALNTILQQLDAPGPALP